MKRIPKTYDFSPILKIFEYILREQLGISKLILYAFDQKNWKCILHFGAKGLNKKIDVAEELIHIKDITVIESSSIEIIPKSRPRGVFVQSSPHTMLHAPIHAKISLSAVDPWMGTCA